MTDILWFSNILKWKKERKLWIFFNSLIAKEQIPFFQNWKYKSLVRQIISVKRREVTQPTYTCSKLTKRQWRRPDVFIFNF